MKLVARDRHGQTVEMDVASLRVYSDHGHLFMAAVEHGINTIFYGHLQDDDWDKLIASLGLDRVESPAVKTIDLSTGG